MCNKVNPIMYETTTSPNFSEFLFSYSATSTYVDIHKLYIIIIYWKYSFCQQINMYTQFIVVEL